MPFWQKENPGFQAGVLLRLLKVQISLCLPFPEGMPYGKGMASH
jgi:hypothetical protein